MADGKPQDRIVDFHALFDSLPGLFCIIEPDEYRIVAVSDQYVEAVMKHREDLLGERFFEAFPAAPDDKDSVKSVRQLRDSFDKVKELRRNDELPILRYPLMRPESEGGGFEERYASIVNAPVTNGDGKLEYIAQHVEDVTEFVHLRQREGKASRRWRWLESRTAQMEADIVTRSQELKRLNEHFRFAQRVACIGSMELDVRSGIRTWTDEVYRILGIEPGTPPSSDLIASIVHPDDKPLLDEARARALRGEQTEFEHRIIRPGGELRHVRERVQLVTNDDGEPVRMFGTLEDITDQVRNQERLRRNEHMIRVAGQMAKVGAWQVEFPSRTVTWSDQVAALHEVPPGEPLPLSSAIEFIAPEWRDAVRDALDAAVNDNEPYDLEFQIITATGRRAWARAIGQAVYDEKGKVTCIQGALQDITERKQSDLAIKSLADKLSTTLEFISDGFATVDNEWRVTFMNRQAERILGQSREDVLGKRIWDEYKAAIDTPFESRYRQAKAENRAQSFEEYYEPLDLWLDVTAYPSPEGLAIYFRDISDRKRAEAANREVEESTWLIIENALDATISIDSESVITGWNPQAEKTFGWSRDEAVGRMLYELVIPEDFREAHQRGIERFLATGEGNFINRHIEVSALHRDGHEFPVELSIVPLKKGGIYTFSAFVRDITNRKAAELALRESEERFRTVARVTADAVWDWDLVTNTIWWSGGIQTIFGYERDELKAESDAWTERIHPEDRERVVSSLEAAMRGKGGEWREEYRFLRRNGTVAHVIDKGSVIRDASGKAIRMVGGLNDVTQQTKHESQLQQQAALLDQARDAIIVRDINDRITYWNKGAERLYGWTEKEALGREMEELLRPQVARFRRARRKLYREGSWTGEIRKTRKDGEVINIAGAWTLVKGKHGEPESVLTIDTDITERVALEEQLRQSQRLESIGKLTGGVAHDFNNLLTVILGNAELMIDQLPGKDNDRLRKLAEMSRTAAQRGAELTHRLLAFARRQALEPDMIDVNELVLGMEDLVRRTLLENIDIEVIPKEDAWQAYADPGQLEAVLLNLAINARDAMPDGGILTIEIDNVELDEAYATENAEVEPGAYVLIAVSDTGVGIPPEDIDRVFDPFFTTKEKGKGTGLGLSMAYGFAKQSEGHIKIYSETGQGTTVKLYLPKAKQAEKEDAAEPAGKSPAAAEPSGSEKVLVVEDDELVRQHAARQLDDLGYEVLIANDGPGAMEIIKKENDIDLLFTDVIMSGGMTGRELAEMAQRLRPKLKVLYTSGYTENAIVHQGRLDRGVHLLQKPYQRAELAKKLRRALREPSPGDHDGSRTDSR